MLFLCDQMLVRLGRWLRAAGYDTAIAGHGDHDGIVLAWARDEARILLTCDRRLKGELAPGDPRVMVLTSSDPDTAAPELSARLGIDWQAAPFSRCMMDNTPLRPASDAQRRRVPGTARDLPGPVMACPTCARLYWPGSHVRRMRSKLARWNGG